MKLNEEGFRTNKGHLFRTTFIARTLRNRAYIGILDYNRSQTRGPREPIALSGFYPPIVEEELFTRALERLKSERENFQNAYAHRTQYLLSRPVVLDQIQAQILTEANVRKYIGPIVEKTRTTNAEPSAEEKAVGISIAEVASRIRRWEETLERGLLSLEESAHRIKELRQECEALSQAQSRSSEKVAVEG